MKASVTDMLCMECNFILMGNSLKNLGQATDPQSGFQRETIEVKCENCGSKYTIYVEQISKATKTKFNRRAVSPE